MEHEAKVVLGFSLDEVKQALLDKLMASNHPYPPGRVIDSAKLKLTETGATLEWVNQYETTF